MSFLDFATDSTQVRYDKTRLELVSVKIKLTTEFSFIRQHARCHSVTWAYPRLHIDRRI